MRYVWNMKWHEIHNVYVVVRLCVVNHLVCETYIISVYFECFENEYKEQKKKICIKRCVSSSCICTK